MTGDVYKGPQPPGTGWAEYLSVNILADRARTQSRSQERKHGALFTGDDRLLRLLPQGSASEPYNGRIRKYAKTKK